MDGLTNTESVKYNYLRRGDRNEKNIKTMLDVSYGGGN